MRRSIVEVNRTSRYHIVIQAAQKVANRDPERAVLAETLTVRYERKLLNHRLYIEEHGIDPREITGWRWTG